MNEQTTEPTWSDTFKRLSELWPKWTPTDAERELLRDRLRPLRQKWLMDAVKEHRLRDATGNTPKFDVLLRRYAAIAHAGDQKGETAGQWRATWTTKREGQKYATSSLATFVSREAALQYAGGREDAGAYLIGESFGASEEDARIAREDDMEATETLLKASAGKIADAVAWCRSVAVLRGEQLDPDPRKWTRFARGVVCAAMTKETT